MMNSHLLTDTIAAIATPTGVGGIAVIRVSGKEALAVVDSLFRSRHPLRECPSHTVHLGSIASRDGEMIDSVLATVFHGPHSYTGETVVELSCHGGIYISRRVLCSVIAAGARLARPGEFTERAFLNGKMDLTQAEAVADLIHSQSESFRRASLEQLHGRLGNRIRELRQELVNLCSLLELGLDFSEEGLELTSSGDTSARLARLIQTLSEMSDSFAEGRLVREGVKMVLAGRPNVGKSSLLNILLKEDRAIVSDIPGTTRDVIEENVSIDGVLFRLVDTAGLRRSGSSIEREGVRRTESKLQEADLILFVIDSSKIMNSGDRLVLQDVGRLTEGFGTKLVIVLNKADLEAPSWEDCPEFSERDVIRISCKTHFGIDTLKTCLLNRVLPHHQTMASSPAIQNSRHKIALDQSIDALKLAAGSMETKMSNEFATVDIHRAMDALGEIIGITTPDDILENVFAKFCIGK
jgi:tRNA modification GTPase